MEDKHGFRLWLAATLVLPPVYFLLYSEEGWKVSDPVGWWISLILLMALFVGLVSPYVLENVKRWQESRASSRKSSILLPESQVIEKPARKRLRAGIVLAVTAIVFGCFVSAVTYPFATAFDRSETAMSPGLRAAMNDPDRARLVFNKVFVRFMPTLEGTDALVHIYIENTGPTTALNTQMKIGSWVSGITGVPPEFNVDAYRMQSWNRAGHLSREKRKLVLSYSTVGGASSIKLLVSNRSFGSLAISSTTTNPAIQTAGGLLSTLAEWGQ